MLRSWCLWRPRETGAANTIGVSDLPVNVRGGLSLGSSVTDNECIVSCDNDIEILIITMVDGNKTLTYMHAYDLVFLYIWLLQ
jgi:hypothetical protein